MSANPKRLWLIDAGYLFNAQRTVAAGYQFDYLRLRARLEESGPLWRAYYLNSTPNPPTDAQDGFHTWLRSGPPRGPKLITKLYSLKTLDGSKAFCESCKSKVYLKCPNDGQGHILTNQQQKGVDVGIATLALTHREHYETLVLSSGDGDLLDAVEFLSERGTRIELLVFKDGVATDLQARADSIFWIDDFANDVKRAPSAGAA